MRFYHAKKTFLNYFWLDSSNTFSPFIVFFMYNCTMKDLTPCLGIIKGWNVMPEKYYKNITFCLFEKKYLIKKFEDVPCSCSKKVISSHPSQKQVQR